MEKLPKILTLLAFLGFHCSTCHMSRFMTKPTKWHVRPAKTQISLGIHPLWSESSPSAWIKLGSLATHWVQGKTLIRLGGCPGWSESSLAAHSCCWFCHDAALIHLYYHKSWLGEISWIWSFGYQWLNTVYVLICCLPVGSMETFDTFLWHSLDNWSQLMRLLNISSSVNSFFKRACAAFQWG